MPPIKGLLIDLDGVMYVDNTPIAGAIDTIATLQQQGLAVRFLTNTSTRSLQSLWQKLHGMGLDIGKEQIFSSPAAAVGFLQQRQYKKVRLLLDDDVKQDFSQFQTNEDTPDAIVLGDIGDRWNYDLLNGIFRQVITGSEMVFLHRNRFWQTGHGLNLDIGAFAAALEYATGKKAHIMGKPSREFFQLALDDMGLTADQAVMIGDDIDSDIGGAQALGITSLLVKTGKYREEVVRQSAIKPDALLDSIASLPQWLAQQQ